jgi:hypothetical protein
LAARKKRSEARNACLRRNCKNWNSSRQRNRRGTSLEGRMRKGMKRRKVQKGR